MGLVARVIDGAPENIQYTPVDVNPKHGFEFLVQVFGIRLVQVINPVDSDHPQFRGNRGPDPRYRFQLFRSWFHNGLLIPLQNQRPSAVPLIPNSVLASRGFDSPEPGRIHEQIRLVLLFQEGCHQGGAVRQVGIGDVVEPEPGVAGQGLREASCG